MSSRRVLPPLMIAVFLQCLLPDASLAGTLPEVSVSQDVSQTSEAGGAPAVFTFTRTGSTSQALQVYFEPVAGSEANGDDWSSDEIRNLSGGRRGIIIPVGESTYVVEITADPDNLVEGPELLLQGIMPRSTYTIAADSEGVFSTTLLDDPPEVSIALEPGSIMEGGPPGSMTLTRSGGDLSGESRIQVSFNEGTAINGVDFDVEAVSSSPAVIIIPGGQTSETRAIIPEADNLIEGNETISFQILPSTSTSNNYVIVTPTATIDLIDDAPTVSIVAIDPDASESGDPGVFRISRTDGDIETQLFVYLERAGTAAGPGQSQRDYDMDLNQNINGLFVLLAANELELDVLVEPLSDTQYLEPDETVILTIRDDIGEYLVHPAQQSATVFIENVGAAPDLAVSKINGASVVAANQQTTYFVDVENVGDAGVSGATLSDTLPATLDAGTASWTCSGSSGAVCPDASGSGNISEIVDLPAGGMLSYELTATVLAIEGMTVINTATVTLPDGVSDLNPADNSASDSDPVSLFADSFEDS